MYWTFPSDRADRNALFAPEAYCHPAKLHLGLLLRLVEQYTQMGETILDPMGGSGSLLLAAHHLRHVVLRDLEAEYVALMERSAQRIRDKSGLFCGSIDIAQGDARTATYPAFHHIITSPPYGFETGKGITPERLARLQQMPNVTGKVNQRTFATYTGGFRYQGGRNNAGNKSGRNYWADMRLIYANLAGQMPTGGRMILVLKDHYRRGKRVEITAQTIVEVERIGLRFITQHGRKIEHLAIWQRERAKQGLPVVDVEDVLVFVK